jgi:hypothetical protein
MVEHVGCFAGFNVGHYIYNSDNVIVDSVRYFDNSTTELKTSVSVICLLYFEYSVL